MSTIESAITIARENLRSCYRDQGIITGSRDVYWSWDSFFASFGSLQLGDQEIVKRNLNLYLSYQNKDGAIPKRIANPLYWMYYLGIPISKDPEHFQPTFWNSYFTAQSLTQNPTCLIAAHEYVMQSNDQDFLLEIFPKLQRIVHFLANHEDKHGLLWEGIGGGWAESVLKRGEITFTNICYARGIQGMAELAERIGDAQLAEEFTKKFAQLKDAINKRLWHDNDGGYYSDWYGYRRYHHFATDGNLLAIWWGIATDEQAAKIQQKIDSLALESDIPIKLAYDPYAFWRIYIFNRIGGMKDYHVGFSWTWLGCVDALAKLRLGKKDEAINIIERIAQVIVRDKTVHEIYHNGKAVRTFFYKSEHPWAWGAGIFLYACSQLGFNLY